MNRASHGGMTPSGPSLRILAFVPLLWLGLLVHPARSADIAGLLDRAADAGADLRSREFAARQILMLADPSASIFLVSALKGEGSDSALRRQVAATLLGESGFPGAEAALLEAAAGGDYFLAEAAKTALARLYSRLSDGEIYTLLTKGARERNDIPGGATEDGEEDWLALSLARSRHRGWFKALVMRGLALKYAGTGQALPEPLTWCVWDAMGNADASLRLAALRVLPCIASPLATERLAGFLYTETDTKVLVAALQAMRTLRPPDYGEAVERAARSADPMVALEAYGALDAMGYPQAMVPPPGVRGVAGYVNHPSTPVRRRAIELLGESRDPAVGEYLESALRDRVGANRALAARLLGEMGFAGAVGGLSPLLLDGRPEVRCEAAVALEKLGVVGVVSRTVDEARGGAGPFRLAAVRALGRMGDVRAVPALLEIVQGGFRGDAETGYAAVAALGALGDKRAGRVLYDLMTGGGDAGVGDACRGALAEIYLEDPGSNPENWADWAQRNLQRQ